MLLFKIDSMMNERKNIVIIGAGVSGLASGIVALQNGFDVTLIEKNPLVGGLCMGWYRRGRYLDGCIHWLTGSKSGCDLYDMWTNVHAFRDERDIIQLDSFGTFEYQGTKVTFWRDITRARAEWISISKEDTKMINKFFDIVEDFMAVPAPIKQPVAYLPLSVLLSFIGKIIKHPSYLYTMRMSCEGFAKKFKHPALRWALTHVQPGPGNLFSMIYSYSTITDNNGGVPRGGSLKMVNNMKDYYLELGGKLLVNSPVEKINVDKKKKVATSVTLENGKVIEGDYIIASLDPNFTLTKLLNNKYPKNSFDKRIYNYKKNPLPGCVLLQFEIEDLPEGNYPLSFEIEPLKVGKTIVDHLTLRSHAYDKETYVRDNKVICSMLIDQYDEDYYEWKKLLKDETYKDEKNRIASECVKRIVKQLPSLEGKVTVLDVATPWTFKRYTNTTRGGYMSFMFTTKNDMYSSDGRVMGINNLYLSGNFMASPGGLPFALSTGYHAVQRICRRENIKYALATQRELEKEY